VAHYHSPDPLRGQDYVEQVKAALERGPVAEQKRPPRPVPEATTPLNPKEKNPTTTAFVVHRRDQKVFARVDETQSETTAFVRRVNGSQPSVVALQAADE